MVHVKEDYVSEDGTVDLDSALMAEDGLAVFGIFITGGADNATWFDVVASAAKDIVDSGDYSTEVDPATVNLNQIKRFFSSGIDSVSLTVCYVIHRVAVIIILRFDCFRSWYSFSTKANC